MSAVLSVQNYQIESRDGDSLAILRALADGPATAGEIAVRLEINPGTCQSLLMGLRTRGLVYRDGDLFSNSVMAGYVTSRSPEPFWSVNHNTQTALVLK